MRSMLKPFFKLRNKIRQAVADQIDYLDSFKFKFCLERDLVEQDVTSRYCVFDDFAKLCSSDAGNEFT